MRRRAYVPAQAKRFRDWLQAQAGQVPVPDGDKPAVLSDWNGTEPRLPADGQECLCAGQVPGCLREATDLVLMVQWPLVKDTGVPLHLLHEHPDLFAPLCQHCVLLYYTSHWEYRCKDRWVNTLAAYLHRAPATVRACYEAAVEVMGQVTYPARDRAEGVLVGLLSRVVRVRWSMGEPVPELLRLVSPQYVLSSVEVLDKEVGDYVVKLWDTEPE